MIGPGLLGAQTDEELARVVRSLPLAVALTSTERRLAEPLEIRSGIGRLRLAGLWQVARQTHVSADLGSIRIDLTEAEFETAPSTCTSTPAAETSPLSFPKASRSGSSATTAESIRGCNHQCPDSHSSGPATAA
jgi:hypothetical protein